MHFDWTINVPLCLSLLGGAAAIYGRFVRLETLMDGMRQWSRDHQETDDKHFERLDGRLDQLRSHP